jgi:hypothetical protein
VSYGKRCQYCCIPSKKAVITFEERDQIKECKIDRTCSKQNIWLEDIIVTDHLGDMDGRIILKWILNMV